VLHASSASSCAVFIAVTASAARVFNFNAKITAITAVSAVTIKIEIEIGSVNTFALLGYSQAKADERVYGTRGES